MKAPGHGELADQSRSGQRRNCVVGLGQMLVRRIKMRSGDQVAAGGSSTSQASPPSMFILSTLPTLAAVHLWLVWQLFSFPIWELRICNM